MFRNRLPWLLALAVVAPAWPALADDSLPAGAVVRLGSVRLRHGGPVIGLAFSPDGRTIITASADRTARIWDAATGKELARLVHDAEVRAVAVSSDGKRIA